jgi:RimJ/RimL family protein N-acetyltransferase
MDSQLALRLSEGLQTTRLVLEPMGERHADAFFEPMHDEALYQWISMDKPLSLESLRAHWRRSEVRIAPDGKTAWPTWAVRCKETGRFIGRVDAEVDDALVCLNLGYYLFSSDWGQGYATEAVLGATAHLIERGVRRLVATVTVGNHASERVLQKAGYTLTRVLPGNDTIRGVVVDDLEYVRI